MREYEIDSEELAELNPYLSLLDEITDTDTDDLRWGLAVPDGWKNR